MKHSTRLRLIKGAFAVLLVFLLFIPTSINHPQIDMRAMVVALGIDIVTPSESVATDKAKAEEKPGEGKICATVEIVLPVEGGGSIGASEVVSGEGNSLSEAFESISISLGRKLELNHCGIIVIGKGIAQKGVSPQLEYLLSAGLMSPETNLILSDNKDAQEFLDILKEYSSKLDLSNLLRYVDMGAQVYSKGMVHFLREIRSNSRASAIPCIKMGYAGEKSSSGESPETQSEPSSGGGDAGGGGGGGSEKQAVIQSSRKLGVFGFDDKQSGAVLKAVWGETETFGMAWLDQKTTKGYVFLEDLELSGLRIDSLPLKLEKKNVKIKTAIRDGKPVYTLKLKLSFKIEDKHRLGFESYDRNRNVLKRIYPEIERAAEKVISDAVLAAFDAAKRDGSDALLVEDSIFRNHHKRYKKMSENGFDFLTDSDIKTEFKITLN